MTSLPVSSPMLGWHRRPELWSVVLSAVGVALAGYLTIVHFRESLLVCSGISDCETVQTSRYAEILGIPVALLGLLCFVALLGLAIVRIFQPERADIITMIMFVMVVGSIGFYIYLTYLELFVIDAICQWCVASSLVMIGMLVTESILLRRVLSIPEE